MPTLRAGSEILATAELGRHFRGLRGAQRCLCRSVDVASALSPAHAHSIAHSIGRALFSPMATAPRLRSGDFYVGHHTLINVTGVLDCERMSLQRYAEIFVLAAATVRDNLRLEYGSTFQATAVIAGDAYVHVRGGAHLAANAGRITAGVLQLDSLASIYSTERVVVTAALNAAPHFTTSGCGGTVTAGTASCTVSMLGYRNTKSVNCVSYIDGWYNDSISVNLQNADQLDCPCERCSPPPHPPFAPSAAVVCCSGCWSADCPAPTWSAGVTFELRLVHRRGRVAIHCLPVGRKQLHSVRSRRI